MELSSYLFFPSVVISIISLMVAFYLISKHNENIVSFFYSIICKPGVMVLLVIIASYMIHKNSSCDCCHKELNNPSLEIDRNE